VTPRGNLYRTTAIVLPQQLWQPVEVHRHPVGLVSGGLADGSGGTASAHVRDELLGELCRADDVFVPGFVYSLAPDVRASLALFCYRRTHLHSIGLAIAASCDEDSLVWAGGSVGAFVFACSRQASPREVQSPRTDRRKITLATGVLRMFANDDEMVQETPTAPLRSVDIAFGRA
jgi:hypothetical protein